MDLLGGKSALTLEVKLEGADRLGVWIGTHFGSEFGGCVLGGWICWGRIGTHFRSKVGGGIGVGISWGVDQLGGQISTYFGSEFGGVVWGARSVGGSLHSP